MRQAALAIALVVAACGGAAEPPPPVDDVRATATEAMLAVESAAFSIERSGAPITISGLEFLSATGEYAAPDGARAILDVSAAGVTARLGTVAIGPRVWLTDPISGAWNELDAGTGFNPAVVFDPDSGWAEILRSDLDGATVDAVDDATLRLVGVVSADRVAVLTVGLVTAQPTQITMLIDRATSRLTEVSFDTIGPGGTSSWLISLDRYGEPVTVEPPA